MISTTVYGYPRIGSRREAKRAVEAYWAGRLTAGELAEQGSRIRADTWAAMAAAGIAELPSGDFTLYDHVLDTACVTGLVPPRFDTGPLDLDRYFTLARGEPGTAPLEMTKWFDTNYHYLVPEVDADMRPRQRWRKPLDEYIEAGKLGYQTRPVLLGPVSLLLLSKATDTASPGFEPITLLEPLLLTYRDVLGELAAAGAEWVQLDEPALAAELRPDEVHAVAAAYDALSALGARPKLCVATYYGEVGDALPGLLSSAIEGIGLDFTAPGTSARLGDLRGKRLVAGVVDGRSVWRTDLSAALGTLERLRDLTDDLVVAASCPLWHVPLDVTLEDAIDPRRRRWLAFARQKLDEVALLGTALREGRAAVAADIEESRLILDDRRNHAGTVRDDVRERLSALPQRPRPGSYQRRQAAAGLPALPTTTVGSFPQTDELRQARARLARGECDTAQYEKTIEQEIVRVLRLQEEVGLDLLVHGEPERSDMVQYFAEQLDGFLVTKHGWVRSYGSRYTRPPIITGDVARHGPMTVRWLDFAQRNTDRPVKGMLTGPVTMLKWSFGRDDLPEADVAAQIGLALRDEVADLEAAGLRVIQVDEPAFREAMPLHTEDHKEYFHWATAAFRVATGGVSEQTQIHTHMCYSELGDVLPALAEMDVDVLLVEATRSRMGLLFQLAETELPGGVGPGVYDIHSPQVPTVEEIAGLLAGALAAVPADRLWVTPDCGLKTRRYDEVGPALRNMCAAAHAVRDRLADHVG